MLAPMGPYDPIHDPVYEHATALVVVDVQNDFADPAGSLHVSGAPEILEPLNKQIAAARAAGAFVVFTQDWHPETTPHFARDGGIWPVHCVGGSWGAELHPAVDAGDDPRVRKGVGGEDGYSGFTVADPKSGVRTATGLEDLLRERGIARVVIGGLATDYCVKATALDAASMGFQTIVLSAAIAAVDLVPGDGERAIERMREAGVEVR
jgi:nicotinamidase/pyrazinamidase